MQHDVLVKNNKNLLEYFFQVLLCLLLVYYISLQAAGKMLVVSCSSQPMLILTGFLTVALNLKNKLPILQYQKF